MLSNTYDITHIITAGTYSKLYEGIHIHKKTKVAIKCESDPVSKKLLDHEIDMYLHLKKYKNVKIPTIKSIGTYADYSYIVMELFDSNLRSHFEKGITKMEFICIVLDIITIMRDLHDTGVVHRDIKPENFVLDANKKIYIIDFGLSCIQSERVLNQFIGNKRYASYNCHLPTYTYQKKDDIISVIYMLVDLYKHRLPWETEATYEIKKNANFHDYYKKKDYFLNILFMLYDNVDNPDFYKIAIDELSRTVDYCKSQGK